MSGLPSARRPPASVIVATFNRPEFLPDCLHSIAASLDGDDELVVVEAGNSEANAAIAALPRVATHVRLSSPGKSRQLNEAVRRSRNDILLFTDDDCRVDPAWIERDGAHVR